MSYILDALKKLEQDKARKERVKGGAVNIAGELLTEDISHGTERSQTKLVPVLLIIVLLTAGITWLLLRSHSAPQMAAQSGSQESRPLSAPSAPSPGPAAPLVAPMPVAAAVSDDTPAREADAPKVLQQAATRIMPPAEQQVRPVSASERRRPAAVAPQSVIMAAPANNLVISGIAWQDERSERRAVVNGFLLHEGSVVAGSKIVEILQDRVRFSQGGLISDVPLVASGMPAPAAGRSQRSGEGGE